MLILTVVLGGWLLIYWLLVRRDPAPRGLEYILDVTHGVFGSNGPWGSLALAQDGVGSLAGGR